MHTLRDMKTYTQTALTPGVGGRGGNLTDVSFSVVYGNLKCLPNFNVDAALRLACSLLRQFERV